MLHSTASGLLIQSDRLPTSLLSQYVNTAWVIPDILQSPVLALVTTRLKYMMEHECERWGVSGYVGAGRDGGAEQKYGALD